VVDATRCLAWLVQADGRIPRRWRVALGDRIYGCDDCQEVCPPNREPRHPELEAGDETEPLADIDRVVVDLDWLLGASDEEILDRHGRWYIARRDPDNIRRTALVVLGNVAEPGRPGVRELLDRHLRHDSALLRAHAVWAARRLGLGELAATAADDPDPEVRAELTGEVPARFDAAAWAGAGPPGRREGAHA
jgi:epoxyqueuosine reductase